MSDQPLDLRRSMQALRRRWIVVSLVTLVGLGAGAAYTVYKPPMLSSYALVELSTGNAGIMATQVVIADSDKVLAAALPNVSPRMTLPKLRSLVTVRSLSQSILSITASGKTAAQAETTATAVARSYVSYVDTNSRSLKVRAQLQGPAIGATGPSLTSRMVLTGIVGGLIGFLLAATFVLAFSRRDRRLRQRDEIADAIGVPVLASLPVVHANDASDWSKLFEEYAPGVADGWRMRNALQYLGVSDSRNPPARHHGGQVITVLSLSTDKRAMALGPQFAAFAASLGISTVLAVGRHEDASVTAALRVACTAQPAKRAGHLQVLVADHVEPDWQPDVMLTVVVAIVDGRSPVVSDIAPGGVIVLGVSAGAATADQLARVATSAATGGNNIDGIFVADPDAADPTTGRIPQLVRPARSVQPTRQTGMRTDTRR